MISFENTEVMNIEGAIRGMRNPLNSWEKSDSVFRYDNCNNDCPDCKGCTVLKGMCFKLGENDLDLARRLIAAGSDHRKFLRQIFVSVDITAPLYWWKEFDTYKVATVANSCSTMHTIHKKEFTIEDFSTEHLIDDWISDENLEAFVFDNRFIKISADEPKKIEMPISPKYGLFLTIQILNQNREKFLETKDKRYWWQMIQLLPTSYNQRRTVTLNYETLRNIYGSRRNHKLDEWSIDFMEWIDSLPYADDLIK